MGLAVSLGDNSLVGENRPLSVTHPELAAQLADADPATLFSNVGVARRYLWRCPNHPEPYLARLAHRISGSGCPHCAGHLVLPGFNDLATRHPGLAAELVDADPTQVLAGGRTEYLWHCPKHPDIPYPSTVSARIKGYGCSYCRKRRIKAGLNDLATTHPDLAAELVDTDPTTITSGSKLVVGWRCLNHPEPYFTQARIRTRASRPGCPYCSGREVLVGFNDLATTLPDVAALLIEPDPTTVTAGSGRKGLWRCPNHPEPFEAIIGDRVTSTSHGCGYCRGMKVLPGFNDLASRRPDLAAELIDPDPVTVTFGSNKRGLWRCPNHAEPYTATIAGRVAGGGCGYCAGKRLLPGVNDMATTHPHLAAELVDADPTTLIAGTGKRLRWCCPRGHEYVMTGDARVTRAAGCPYCCNSKVLAGFNDLATTHPDLAAELVDPDPSMVLAGSIAHGRWQCRQCGKQWRASFLNRSGNGSGCPACANSGYDSTKAGYLYLMARHGEQQVGITNKPQQRLAQHRRNGWELVDLTDAMNGERVANIELQVRVWLREQGLRIPGTFEQWPTGKLEVACLKELFDVAGVTDPAEPPPQSRKQARK